MRMWVRVRVRVEQEVQRPDPLVLCDEVVSNFAVGRIYPAVATVGCSPFAIPSTQKLWAIFLLFFLQHPPATIVRLPAPTQGEVVRIINW